MEPPGDDHDTGPEDGGTVPGDGDDDDRDDGDDAGDLPGDDSIGHVGGDHGGQFL